MAVNETSKRRTGATDSAGPATADGTSVSGGGSGGGAVSTLGATEQRILLSELTHAGASISFDAWLTHWNIIAANEPIVAQVGGSVGRRGG